MKKYLPWIIAAVCAVWAITMTYLAFVNNPLPFPDRGHRCFPVPNEMAAKVVAQVLGLGGLTERFTFDSGPTHQTLMSDNTTVLINFDQVVRESGLPLCAISIVVDDPRRAAIKAADMLKGQGFTATIHEDMLGKDMSNKFVLLSSDAFDGWALGFRLHVLKMGKPQMRKILP